MVKNKKIIQQLTQHYAVNPASEFISGLRNDLIQSFPIRQPNQNRPLKITYAIIVAVVAIVILLFATPIGSALAQIFLSLFPRTESDIMPNYPGQTAIARNATLTVASTSTPRTQKTPTPTSTRTFDPASKDNADLALEEVEQTAGFDILVPTYLPDIFVLSGTSYDPGTYIVRHFYDTGLLTQQEPIMSIEDCDLCTDIGPSAEIQTFQIGMVEGEFVAGVWKFDNEGNRYWESDPYMNRLRWQVDGTVFEIMYMGVPGTVSTSQLIKIAESFQ